MYAAKNDVPVNAVLVCESVAQLSSNLHVTRFSRSLYRHSGRECIVGRLNCAAVCYIADVSAVVNLIAFGVKGYLCCLCRYCVHTWVEILRFGSALSRVIWPIVELSGTF
jgi:hypothetical protein